MGCWRMFGLGTRLLSTHCREFNYLNLCRPAYFIRTTQLLPHPGQMKGMHILWPLMEWSLHAWAYWHTECPKSYRKYVLHLHKFKIAVLIELMQYRFAVTFGTLSNGEMRHFSKVTLQDEIGNLLGAWLRPCLCLSLRGFYVATRTRGFFY